MKTLITLILLSLSSLAIADQTIHVINENINVDLSPAQTELYLRNQGVSGEQRAVNNARYAQSQAEQAEANYERWRQYQNGRRATERFIGD